MTFEQRSSGVPAEPAPTPGAAEPVAGGGAGSPTPVQVRLQILSTEHWSLLASRSLAWNESFSRAGMYLSTLSGAMVALALVAQVSDFGDAFVAFAVVLLPIVLFVGTSTLMRMGASNYHDAVCLIGMNRIRGAYLELAPDLEKYFVMSPNDDARGVGITMAVPPHMSQIQHFIAGTPSLVQVLNSVVTGVLVVIVLVRVGIAVPLSLGLGLVAMLGLFGLQILYARRTITRLQSGLRPLFPSPVRDSSEPAAPTAPAEPAA